MTELFDAATSPWSFLAVLIVFGFLPGFLLRLCLLLYPRGHLRRNELLAELYTMKRLWRPFWVMEQFETALFDGLAARYATRQTPFSRLSRLQRRVYHLRRIVTLGRSATGFFAATWGGFLLYNSTFDQVAQSKISVVTILPFVAMIATMEILRHIETRSRTIDKRARRLALACHSPGVVLSERPTGDD